MSTSLHDETTPPDDTDVGNSPDDKMPELSPPPVQYHGRWDEEGEGDEGNSSGRAGYEESDDDIPNYEDTRSRESLPQSTLPMLLAAQKMIQSIKEACIEDDIDDEELLDSLRHPPTETEPLNAITTLSFRIFMGLIGGSEAMYNSVRDALISHSPDLEIHSYHVVRKKAQNITGITQVRTDMCPGSCLAYTGPFATLTECPTCGTPRYEDMSMPTDPKKPRKQFYTIPLGCYVSVQAYALKERCCDLTSA
jgi:hypothetical protein